MKKSFLKKYFWSFGSFKSKYYVSGRFLLPFVKLLDGILGIILLPTIYSPEFTEKVLMMIIEQTAAKKKKEFSNNKNK